MPRYGEWIQPADTFISAVGDATKTATVIRAVTWGDPPEGVSAATFFQDMWTNLLTMQTVDFEAQEGVTATETYVLSDYPSGAYQHIAYNAVQMHFPIMEVKGTPDWSNRPLYTPTYIPPGVGIEYESPQGDYLDVMRFSWGIDVNGTYSSQPLPRLFERPGWPYINESGDTLANPFFDGMPSDPVTPDSPWSLADDAILAPWQSTVVTLGTGDAISNPLDDPSAGARAHTFTALFAPALDGVARITSPSDGELFMNRRSETVDQFMTVSCRYRYPRYRLVYPGGLWHLRSQNPAANAGSWPLRAVKNGGHGGSHPVRAV